MNNALRLIGLFFLAVFAMAATFGMGFATALRLEDSQTLAQVRSAVGGGSEASQPDELQTDGQDGVTAPPISGEPSNFGVFWEAWQLVEDEFYGDLPTETEVTYDALRGSLRALDDPYTAFFDPVVSEINSPTLDGEFEGIGAFVTSNEDGLLVIQTPMSGQPAEKAGVKAGDIVIEVDGEDITDLDLNEAVLLIRGPKGTEVTLTLIREGESAPLKISVVRDRIDVPSVAEVRMLEPEGAPNVGYMQITSFALETEAELETALAELREQGAEAIVMDLRNNPGGYLNTAINVASEFVGEGIVVQQENAEGLRQPEMAKRGGAALDLPVVVLINRGSASASEIVAGAIRDHERGVIVGQTSFGKGSVQNVHSLSDGSELRVTVAVWLTPDGTHIHKQGIIPDIPVDETGRDLILGDDGKVDDAAMAELEAQEAGVDEDAESVDDETAEADPEGESDEEALDPQIERAALEALKLIGVPAFEAAPVSP